MKKFLALSLLINLIACETKKAHELDFLIGDWEMPASKEMPAFAENWSMSDDGRLLGTGYVVRDGENVVYEKMSVESFEGENYLAIDSPDEGVTYFKIIETNDNGFKSHNPNNEFPQYIVYKVDGSAMKAHIYNKDGKEMKFEFTRKK